VPVAPQFGPTREKYVQMFNASGFAHTETSEGSDYSDRPLICYLEATSRLSIPTEPEHNGSFSSMSRNAPPVGGERRGNGSPGHYSHSIR
jgi:hypothetical protein